MGETSLLAFDGFRARTAVYIKLVLDVVAELRWRQLLVLDDTRSGQQKSSGAAAANARAGVGAVLVLVLVLLLLLLPLLLATATII